MKMSGLLISGLCLAVNAQTINLTGTVIDSATSSGISQAKVSVVEIPQCTTRTLANGNFTLTYASTASGSALSGTIASAAIELKGNMLSISGISRSSLVKAFVYNSAGALICHFQKNADSRGTIRGMDIGTAAGVRMIKISIDRNTFTFLHTGLGCSFKQIPASAGNGQSIGMAKSMATYTLAVTAAGFIGKQVSLSITTGNVGAIQLSAQPGNGMGTGGTHMPQYVTVTGGGPMPDISNGYTCNCDGTGATDATSCLQTAANTAASQNKPLLIPYTSGYYKISSALTIRCSVIGTGGMPTIRQTGDDKGLRLAADMTGWIYNLHIVGTYNGGNASTEFNHNISVGGLNGVTIKGNLLETPMGDNIADHSQSSDGSAASRNVLIDNNTMVNPRRCNISLVNVSDRWAVMNNVMSYSARYVDPIDLEPWQESSHITNVEVAYNKCTSPGTAQQFYGKIMDVDDWFDKTPGGNIWGHHNYGTWGVPFGGTSSSWTNVNFSSNVQGNTAP